MSKTVLVDTGCWIALFDPRDENHRLVVETADLIESFHLVFPWPLLYETLHTPFVRHRDWVARLDERLKNQRFRLSTMRIIVKRRIP